MTSQYLANFVLGLTIFLGCSRAPTHSSGEGSRATSAPTLTSVSVPRERNVEALRWDPPEASAARSALVDSIVARDSLAPNVALAMRKVPRHLFVPDLPIHVAYYDAPLPIGEGQTISQPTVVAMMTHALQLRGDERVLEVGTGSGYQAAILSELARAVYTIELIASLGERARDRLTTLGYANVHVRIGDGYAGWPEHAPYDRIIVTAAPPEVPWALVNQLVEGGRLVAPIGEQPAQELVRIRKERGGKTRFETLAPVRFVPMVRPD